VLNEQREDLVPTPNDFGGISGSCTQRIDGADQGRRKRRGRSAAYYAAPQLHEHEQLADILTYVRNAWGNHKGAIAKEAVAKFRAAKGTRALLWAAAELDQLR
jgi:mono/diheme cytochrome c family protein|tara:strand:+ start:8944 stop:9252 length:309 start_codon:yes stop_codon:yes gene_type:complete